MGRLTKEMKKAELLEQLTEANETYLEKTSQHMECQYREMQRVERRIERKKKLIDKKHIVSIKKLEKERKEKLKKIVGRYRRIEEKVREATIDKVDLAEIENIEKGYIERKRNWQASELERKNNRKKCRVRDFDRWGSCSKQVESVTI